MVANFGLLQMPDIGGAFRQGMEQGRALREEQNRRNALMAYNANPQDTAAQNALLSADPRMGMAMIGFNQERAQAQRGAEQAERDREAQQRRQSLEVIGKAAAWADTPEKWDQAATMLEQNGYAGASQYVGQFGQREAILGMIAKEAEQFTLTPGSKRFDARGNLVAEAPLSPEYRTVGEGQTLVEVGGGSGAPRGIRNGNPGNIRDSAWTRNQPGYQGADAQGFAVFAPGYGERAQNALLGSYISRGFDTPMEIASRWAPAGDGSNNPQAYAAQIARDLGIGVNDRVSPQQAAQIAQTITRVENGAYGSGGPRVVAQGKPKPLSGSPDRKAETDLRKEFNNLPEVKDFKDVRANFQQIKANVSKPNKTAQDDIALVFSFMKMLDPGSVVREGEFATAARAAGVPDRIVNYFAKLDGGDILNASQRREIGNTAASIYMQRRETYNAKANEFRDYASGYGVSPDRVARRYVPEKKPGSSVWGKAKVID